MNKMKEIASGGIAAEELLSTLGGSFAAASATGTRDLSHREATRHEQRELFKVLRRDIVELNSKTGEYELKYYGSDSPGSERRIPLSELKTDHSLDDDKYKYRLVWYCCVLGVVICVLPLLNEYTAIAQETFGSTLHPIVSLIVLGAGMGTYFVLVRQALITNFVGVDALWTNAIDQIFSLDVRVRMDGVRDCMLKFRQFIKWRRWANFFLSIFTWVAPAIILAVVVLTMRADILDLFELGAMAVFSAGLAGTIWWFIRQREEHTDWRDPTVQICVAMAEMHRRYVESKILNDGRGAANV